MNLNMENGSVRSSIENVPSTTQSTITLDRKDDDKDEKNDYNPFEHRDVVHPTSTLGAFFHLLKSSLGSGLLAMPAAFRNTGLIPGCIGTVLVGVIATHCVHILVSTSRAVSKNCRAPSLSYTDTCEEVFKQGPKKLQQYSKHIRHFVDAAMAGVCLGGTSVYVIFIASSLKDICDHFVPSKKFEVEVYCGILLLPLILITQIRHLKFLVPFSVIANVCLVVTFGITCFYTFTDLKPLENIEMVASVEKWPLFLSTAIFAMEGINVVMPVENEMAKPQHFLGCPSVLNVTMIFVTILYGVVGIFGYMKYGEGVLGSITLNLPEGENLALTAKILVAVAVFFTYCLQMYAPMDIIWTRIKCRISKNYFNISQITLRTLSVTLTVVLAVAVPDLELLIGLVGAIFFSTLGLLIPVVVQTVHLWEKGLGKFSYILWKNALLLIFYFIVLVSGCYTAVSEIILKFR
ncbi:proton-coupled amino acid transporter-like protein pathetic [Helicoverpa armigera]|uniref:proton-coupled amino acid transporter-like protein pathetic n=1 Tax=Helicoverpa armigera TaxID=29058 RepID=UPI0030836700